MNDIEASTIAIDPVCGMKVDPAKAAAAEEHEGVSHFFCGKGCASKFRADPAKYLQPEPDPASLPPATEAARQTEHLCPMDPEVSKMGPGSCPKCGMTLEPREITADEKNPELDDKTRRL